MLYRIDRKKNIGTHAEWKIKLKTGASIDSTVAHQTELMNIFTEKQQPMMIPFAGITQK